MKRITILSRKMRSLMSLALVLLISQGAMAQYVGLTALSGTGGTGGEGYAKLVDKDISTKMGHSFDPSNPERSEAYIIMKADEAIIPVNYFLVTGNDTGSNPGRNWEDWCIYGANFESDDEATVDADWTLIDERVSEPLPRADKAFIEFKFNKADGATAYKYFYIRITKSVQGTDTWLQMDEFGFGTKEDFYSYLNAESSVNEPVSIRILGGTRNNGDGEGLAKLFDGDYTTKWGNGLPDDGSGNWFIIRTSRPMAPTYYRLVTGVDNATWRNRNWKDYKIYGIAEADESKVTRDAEGWVLLDNKVNVSSELLPDKNCFEVFMELSEANTTKYSYFKVEVTQIMGGASGYMQMGEFSLGDEHTLSMDVGNVYNRAVSAVSTDIFAEKALTDEYAGFLENLKGITMPVDVNNYIVSLDGLQSAITASAAAYATLTTAVRTAQNACNDNSLDAVATEYINKYAGSEAIAPNDEFPCGNFAYIQANCQLTGEEAANEATRINAYVAAHTEVAVDPIYASYEALSGSGGFSDAESHGSLIDGDKNGTKWCSNDSKKPWYIVFKSDSPIKPTYYGLVTGGDTKQNPSRNWKDWNIYAGDFASDEDAAKDAEGWVLIDSRTNVGTDLLKTENVYESFFTLAEPPAKEYSYYKIEVLNSGGDLQQMNEFTFYNQGNFNEQRDIFKDEVQDSMAFAGFDAIDEETLCYKPYYEEYVKMLAQMDETMDAVTLINAKNRLMELITLIRTSNETWQNYVTVMEGFNADDFADYEDIYAWATGYQNENEGPSAKYKRGTYEYLVTNRDVTDEELKAETETVEAYIYALNEYEMGYIVLDGHTASQWGDGHYKHLVDNNMETKWGGEASVNGDSYVIFRTLGPVNPFFYTLTTGGDTYSFQGRNWKTWRIYGANFNGDGEATKDAEGWVLVDEKTNVGQERLSPANLTASYFGFSTETTQEYTYYKVVVFEAYSGSAIQMQELHFGTEEEFEEIRNDYINKAQEFDYDIVCDQALIDEYEKYITEIEECTNMEVLFRVNYSVSQLQKSITSSAATYAHYEGEVNGVKAYLEANKLGDSEALSALTTYLNETEEPAEDGFPNGSARYILDNHVLTDSAVVAEEGYLESLKAAAVKVGYGPGVDVTSLIVNPSFAKAEAVEGGKQAAGWDGLVYGNGTNEERTMSAAEFCNDLAKFDISQTLTDMKNGYYQVKLNAGFRPNGDIKSYNYTALAYANDTKTYLPAVIEDMVAKDDAVNRENCWLEGNVADKPIINENDTTDTLGYVIWGVQSCCYAFAAERYEIPMVAHVTDGTLTIGVKNDGTFVGGDWTGVGNFSLTYLGESEADAAEAIAAAVAYNAKRAATMTGGELYIPEDAYDTKYDRAPSLAAADKDALNAIASQDTYADLVADGALFETINRNKAAYVQLYVAKNKVYDKWINHSNNHPELDQDIYDVCDNLNAGTYANAEAALATIDVLYEAYPDYLEIDIDKLSRVNVNETADFEYEITANGMRPYVILKGFYEPLTEDRVILAYEYKSAKDFTNGEFLFGTPNVVSAQSLPAANMTASEEWKRVYVDITDAIGKWGFGSSADHVIRWDLVGSVESTDAISARNFIVITTEECDDDDFVTGVDAIEPVGNAEGDVIYNISGQRVGKAGKGIFIINGKKYLMK